MRTPQPFSPADIHLKSYLPVPWKDMQSCAKVFCGMVSVYRHVCEDGHLTDRTGVIGEWSAVAAGPFSSNSGG